jgi:tetratricopeptide (TPR) repeat protein
VDARVALLSLPSLAVLGLLAVHAWRTLPRARAAAFWGSVCLYGLVRGGALRFAIARLPGASFPYAMRDPLLPVLGVPLQEIAGWAIVAYLGWWLGCRASRRLCVQVAFACVFLGSVSWTVETAAVAAGWWTWTIPADAPLLLGVPSIALVDWAFVGIDFLLPLAATTAPALRGRRLRFLALLAFPLHFAAHTVADRALGPIPLHHLVHWIGAAVLVWLAWRSRAADSPFSPALPWMPLSGLGVIVASAALAELLLVRRPALLVSVLPTLGVAAVAFMPRPRLGHDRSLRVAGAGVALLALLAYGLHARQASRQQRLLRGLDAALASRDRGDLAGARGALASLAADHPGSHVPLILLGEIDYRTDRLAAARDAFAGAAAIKRDDVRTYRYLAVIDRRLGRGASAKRQAEQGLALDAKDPELLYLAGRRATPSDPRTAQTLASLAFEVGDVASAAAILDRALARWPEERSFYPSRVNLALHEQDLERARHVLAAWLTRFPDDAEARRLAAHLAAN